MHEAFPEVSKNDRLEISQGADIVCRAGASIIGARLYRGVSDAGAIFVSVAVVVAQGENVCAVGKSRPNCAGSDIWVTGGNTDGNRPRLFELPVPPMLVEVEPDFLDQGSRKFLREAGQSIQQRPGPGTSVVLRKVWVLCRSLDPRGLPK